jgi:pimeloyl-ACP methyl ester carboxylesterase
MHLLASLLTLAVTSSALAQKPAIVLVHGAFADASSWSKVIPILEQDGYFVTAVQIPLTSLPDDVAVAKRVIDAQKGAVVVVGHSYAGAVITDAAAGNPNVKSLVYVNAFAPDAGEALAEAGNKFPQPSLNSALIPDAARFLYIDRAKVHDVFCKDLPASDARIIAATQKPLNKAVFDASGISVSDWHDHDFKLHVHEILLGCLVRHRAAGFSARRLRGPGRRPAVVVGGRE